jgi:uncharacterized protein YfkK (UPF0435 family)
MTVKIHIKLNYLNISVHDETLHNINTESLRVIYLILNFDDIITGTLTLLLGRKNLKS